MRERLNEYDDAADRQPDLDGAALQGVGYLDLDRLHGAGHHRPDPARDRPAAGPAQVAALLRLRDLRLRRRRPRRPATPTAATCPHGRDGRVAARSSSSASTGCGRARSWSRTRRSPGPPSSRSAATASATRSTTSAHIMGESMEALIHHFKLVTEGFRVPAGPGLLADRVARAASSARTSSATAAPGPTACTSATRRSPTCRPSPAMCEGGHDRRRHRRGRHRSTPSWVGWTGDEPLDRPRRRERDARRSSARYPQAALGAAADAAPRAGRGGLRQPDGHRVLRRDARASPRPRSPRSRRSTRCTSAARSATTTSASAPTRSARSWAATQIFAELKDHLGVGNDETTEDGKVTPRAHRVQRGLRLRAGRDGQLGVLRQPDAGVGQASSSTTCAPARPAEPTRGADSAVHLQARSRGCSPASTTAGPTRAPAAGAGRCARRASSGAATADDRTARRRRRPVARTLTPVLSAHWDASRLVDPRRATRAGGYAALRKALAMDPDAVIQLVKDSGLRGRGGAGFPTGMKWGFIPQGDGKPHYLVVNADESEPGTCKDIPLMMANPHALVEGVIIASYAIRANHAFIYVRGEVAARRPPAAGRGRARPTPPATSARTSSAPATTSSSSCTPARAPTSAARRRRCSTRSRATAASPGCARRSRPSPASTPARRSSTTSSRSPACRRSCATAPSGSRSMGTEKSPGLHALLAVRPRHHARPVRGAARHHAARAARPGRRRPRGPRAEVLDAGRLVDADPHRRAPRRAARLRGRRRGRVDARHQGAADLRRDDLRGARGAALDRVLRARVVRQVHAVPRGHLLAGADPASGSRRARAPRRTSTPCSTSATTSSAASFCALGDGATSPITSSIQYFSDEYIAHCEQRRLPVRPGGLDPVRGRSTR